MVGVYSDAHQMTSSDQRRLLLTAQERVPDDEKSEEDVDGSGGKVIAGDSEVRRFSLVQTVTISWGLSGWRCGGTCLPKQARLFPCSRAAEYYTLPRIFRPSRKTQRCFDAGKPDRVVYTQMFQNFRVSVRQKSARARPSVALKNIVASRDVTNRGQLRRRAPSIPTPA